MMTKEQAEAGIKAVRQLRERCKYDPEKTYKWDIFYNYDTKEYEIIRYSSVLGMVGFNTESEAAKFLANRENKRLLNIVHHIE